MLGSGKKSFAYDLVLHAQKKYISFVANAETWSEFEEVITRQKFQKWIIQKNPAWQKVLAQIKPLVELKSTNQKSFNLTHPNYKELQKRDHNDLKFLHLCDQEQVDILITQDKDLLDLRTHNKTKILRPDEALFLIQLVFEKMEVPL